MLKTHDIEIEAGPCHVRKQFNCVVYVHPSTGANRFVQQALMYGLQCLHKTTTKMIRMILFFVFVFGVCTRWRYDDLTGVSSMRHYNS